MSEFLHANMSPWGYIYDAETLPDFLNAAEFGAFTNGKFGYDTRIDANIPAATEAIRNYCGWHVSPNLTCGMIYNVRDLRDAFTGPDLLVQLPATFVTSIEKIILNAVMNQQTGEYEGDDKTDDYDLGGDGLLVSFAGEMKKAGKSIDEVAEWLENNKQKCHQTGTVDDLKFLAKMGRCSNVSAFMGSLINIKPLAEFNRDGMNQIITKVTGYKKLFTAMIEYMKATIEPEPKRIFVSHSYRKAQWLQLQELIKEEFPSAEIIPTTVNMANGSSIGPGMVVTFYMGKEISEGLVEETKILEEIKAKL